jgi:hypothetical protein
MLEKEEKDKKKKKEEEEEEGSESYGLKVTFTLLSLLLFILNY